VALLCALGEKPETKVPRTRVALAGLALSAASREVYLHGPEFVGLEAFLREAAADPRINARARSLILRSTVSHVPDLEGEIVALVPVKQLLGISPAIRQKPRPPRPGTQEAVTAFVISRAEVPQTHAQILDLIAPRLGGGSRFLTSDRVRVIVSKLRARPHSGVQKYKYGRTKRVGFGPRGLVVDGWKPVAR
jgi:hypothetical protein